MASRNSSSTKYTVYVVLIVALALIYVVKYGPPIELTVPTPARIAGEKTKIRKAKEAIARLASDAAKLEHERAEIAQLASDFWPIDPRLANQVQQAINRLGNKTGVRFTKVDTPRLLEIADHVNTVQVDFSSGTTMKAATEFLIAVEAHQPRLFWEELTITPNRPKNPTGVTLNGKLRAYVLSQAATDYLEGKPDEELAVSD